jgi:hypothetical protein
MIWQILSQLFTFQNILFFAATIAWCQKLPAETLAIYTVGVGVTFWIVLFTRGW